VTLKEAEIGLRCERSDGFAVVTLDRPDVRNALDSNILVQLNRTFEELDSNRNVLVVVLTGSGRTFCSGMDLKAFARDAARGRSTLPDEITSFCAAPFHKPLIAAVNGAALAAGCEIVLKCDLVIATESSTFGIPEVRRGLVAGSGGLVRLPRRIPTSLACELAFTGQPITAQRAYEVGLVNHVTSDSELIAVATGLARDIAGNAPLAVRASKQIMLDTYRLPDAEAMDRSDQLSRSVFESADAREGAEAFAQKRPPLWMSR
jgi:enoyl-CoA hydratase